MTDDRCPVCDRPIIRDKWIDGGCSSYRSNGEKDACLAQAVNWRDRCKRAETVLATQDAIGNDCTLANARRALSILRGEP